MNKTKRIISILICISILFTNTISFASTFEVDGVVFKNFDITPEQETGPSELDLTVENLLSQEPVEETSSFMSEVINDSAQTLSLMSVEETDSKPEFGSAVKGNSSLRPVTEEELAEMEDFADSGEEDEVELFAVSTSSYESLHSPSFKNGVNHPHLSGRNVSEYVSPFDGTLQLNYNDLHLPGRNGLDLNLNRIYKSELSNVEASNATENYVVNNGTYYTNRYALGLGWAFGFPSVELRKKNDGTYQAYYHDGTGAAYRSNYNDSETNVENGYLNYDTNLDNFYTNTVEFNEEDDSYTSQDGSPSQYSFKTADNTMQYFGHDGRLLAIKDRFENEIKFEYEYLPGENILPFYSYDKYELGSLWDKHNSIIYFNNETTNTESDTAKSQLVKLNELYDEYYISLLYEALEEEMDKFEGSFKVYCDLYSDGIQPEESILIADVTPDKYNQTIKIDANISLNDYEFDENPTKIGIRIEVKNGLDKIGFTNIRISPRMPLISKITDTIGRTLVFDYIGDIYTKYEGSPTLPLYINVYDPSGNEIRELRYIRNVYTFTVDNETPYEYYEQRFFFLWGCNNGLETNRVDYEYFDGQGSTIYYQPELSTRYEFTGRPIVNVLENRNSETHIAYEKVKKWTDGRTSKNTTARKNNTGFIETWRVTEKYDINNSVSDIENPEYNIYSYNYSTGQFTDETGYNHRVRLPEGPGYLDPDIGSYKVIVTNPNGSQHLYEYTSHTFDINYRRKWEICLPLVDMEKITESNETSADYVMTEYEYEDNFAIISPSLTKTTECTDGTSREYYSISQYDDESCLPVSSSLPLTEDEVDNVPQEKLIATEYAHIGSNMYLPKKISYYKDYGENILTNINSYDSLGRVITSTDAVGNRVNYEYSEKYPWMPSRTSYTDPENTGDTDRVCETLYEYDDDYGFGATKEKIKFDTDKYAINEFEYEPKYGNIISSSENGVTTTFEYDDYGRTEYVYHPIYAGDGNCRIYDKYTYVLSADYNNEYVTSIDKATILEYVDYNLKAAEEYANYKYDDYGNLLYQNTYAGEEKYIYDSAMRVVGYQNPSDFGTENISESYVYDGFDRVLSATDKEGNIQQADYKSLSTEYSFMPGEGSDEENHVSVNYDMYGRTVSENIYPDGLSGTPLTTSYEYDLAGNVLRVTDANGKITESEYDDINNPVKLTYADGSVVANEYTKWGSIKNTVRTDGIEAYAITNSFNDAGSPLTHRQTGDKINTRAWNYEYDDNGRLSIETDPNGNVNQYEYDSSGNVKTLKNGTVESNYGYTHFNDVEFLERYVNDEMTENIHNVFSKRNLSKRLDWNNDETNISYSYNTARNLTAITPTGYTGVTYTRDSLERVTGITSGEKQFTYEYYADGLVKKLIYPNSDIYVTYTYDNANRLNTLVVNKGTEVLKTYTYTYDNVGNITSVSGSDNISYTYDDLYRLKTYTQDGVTTTYEYDSRNNIKSESRPGYVKIYEYGGDNRLYSTMENGIITEYEYDLNGNIIKRGNDEFGYDQDNRLIYSKVNDIETYYEIGAENLRKKKTTATTTTEYVTDKNGLVICENSDEIINGMTPLAVKRDGSYYYYICNGHGDVVMLLDEQGNVKNSYSYDPWGKIASESETVSNSIKYAGEYYDAENGLIYLRNRYYDPSIGRFTSEDPIEDELNWYVYANNNPVMFVDPWGLAVTAEDIVAFASGLITKDELEAIYFYTDAYEEAEKNNDYARMNSAHSAVVNIRLKYNPDYIDGYDYNHGGAYYAPGNDTVTDMGWVITAGLVGGTMITKAGIVPIIKAGSSLAPVTPKAIEISDKIIKQMDKRGWSVELIKQTVHDSTITREAINKATNNPATAYYTKEGAYVVVDNVSNTVVQISNRLDPANWIPDPTIINPYIP